MCTWGFCLCFLFSEKWFLSAWYFSQWECPLCSLFDHFMWTFELSVTHLYE